MTAQSLQDRLAVSTASLASYTQEEACRIGRELGCAGVELIAFADYRHSQGRLDGFYWERLSDEEKQARKRMVEGFSRVFTHAPFFEMTPLSPNPALRSASRRQLEIAVEAVAELGGWCTTSHAAPKATYDLEASWDELVEMYRDLGDMAAQHGVRITFETCYPPRSEDFARLAHEINHPAVGVTVDVGHLRHLLPAELPDLAQAAAMYNDLIEQHLRLLGDKVFHFHLHDVRIEDLRDHRACGRGIIDYTRLFRVSEEIGFKGFFALEFEESDQVQALQESMATLLAAAEAAEK